jgi:hypothetical protein
MIGGIASSTSATYTGKSPRPAHSTTRISTAVVGRALRALESPTTTNPPLPVWPTNAPSGIAIAAAISRVTNV